MIELTLGYESYNGMGMIVWSWSKAFHLEEIRTNSIEIECAMWFVSLIKNMVYGCQ